MTNEEIQKLIDEGDCDGDCPEKFSGPYRCCFEFLCFKYYRQIDLDEFEKRFTLEEQEKIKSMFDPITGFASKNGCVLPRKWRPVFCIKYKNCKDK